MEVILTKEVEAIGGKNEVVRVKDGFARNYLFPRRLAIPATPGNLKDLSQKIRIASELKTKRLDSARGLAERLSKLSLRIAKKAGKEGKLFGSVTALEVVDAIKESSDLDVDKRKVHIPAHLKTLGSFQVGIRLEVGVTAVLPLEIVSDEPPKTEPVPAGEAPAAAGEAPAAAGEATARPRRRAPRAAVDLPPAAAPAPEPSEEATAEAMPKGPTRKKRRGTSEAEDILPE